MFSTYEALKYPLQMDSRSTVWSGVELTPISSVFAVSTLGSDDDSTSIFLLHGTDDLLAFAKQRAAGRLVGLHLLQPPRRSGDDWKVVAMREVVFQREPTDGSLPSAAAVSLEGILYGGFPINVLEGDPGPLDHLASVGA